MLARFPRRSAYAEKEILLRARRIASNQPNVTWPTSRQRSVSKGTPDSSSLPPSNSRKPNRPGKVKRMGPRQDNLWRPGGGRLLTCLPDGRVIAKGTTCAHRRAARIDAAPPAPTTRSICRRFSLWSRRWNATPDIARHYALHGREWPSAPLVARGCMRSA
jgi:hypothetical protein